MLFCSPDESGCDAIFLADSHFALWCAMISFWHLGCSDAPFLLGEAHCFFVFFKTCPTATPPFLLGEVRLLLIFKT
jgi:hypothetical protein